MKNWLILSFLSASLPLANAVVIFNEIGERGELVLFGNRTIEIDFDGDGVNEIDVIFDNASDVRAITTTNVRMVAIPNTPPDVGSSVFNFLREDEIGPILPFDSLEYFSGRGGMLSCRTIGCIGLWGGGTHFLGVEFTRDEEIHYGYVEIDLPLSSIPAGQVLAYAYEDQPNVPISAGAIPEPSGALLFAMGAIASISKRRRANRDRKSSGSRVEPS
jgi:hypothetical protein